MTTRIWLDPHTDSLDIVERIMEVEEEFGIEIRQGFQITEEMAERCRKGGWFDLDDFLNDDFFNGAPIPRHRDPPSLPGSAEAEPPEDAQDVWQTNS